MKTKSVREPEKGTRLVADKPSKKTRTEQILNWVLCELASPDPLKFLLSGAVAAATPALMSEWMPRGDDEQAYAAVLRRLLLAQTWRGIDDVCDGLPLSELFGLTGKSLQYAENLAAWFRAQEEGREEKCQSWEEEDTRIVMYATTRNVWLKSKKTDEDAAAKQQTDNRLRDQASGAAQARRFYDDDKLLTCVRTYRQANSQLSLNTAIASMLNPQKEQLLRYKNDSSVYRHLTRILRPHNFTPSTWWKSGCPAL